MRREINQVSIQSTKKSVTRVEFSLIELSHFLRSSFIVHISSEHLLITTEDNFVKSNAADKHLSVSIGLK